MTYEETFQVADANAGRCLLCQAELRRKGRGELGNPSYYCSWDHWHRDRTEPTPKVQED